jgi:hypothetical protein
MRRAILALMLLFVPMFAVRSGSQQAPAGSSPADAMALRFVLSEVTYTDTDDGRHVASFLKFQGVEVAAGKVTRLGSQEFDVSKFVVERAALSDASWTPLCVAISSGDYAYVVTRQATWQNTLSRFEPFNPNSKPVNIDVGDLRVTAMIEVAGKLYLGLPGEVRVVDFSEKEPSAREFFSAKRTDKKDSRKTIDAFARCGELVVAIDDVVWPKYAYIFGTDKTGLTTVHEADLPMHANTQYYEAVGDGTRMALLAQFSHRGGSGSIVEFFEVGAKSLEEKLTKVEYVPRDEKQSPSLLAGDDFSSLNGMAFIDGALLVGAGERGILTIPTDVFRKPSLTATKGNCTDILLKDGRLFALVHNGVNVELVEYALAQDTLKETTRLKLEGLPARFAR